MTSKHTESTYRRSYTGSGPIGTVAFVAPDVAGHPVVGAVALASATVGVVELQRGYERPFIDERDDTIVSEASITTVSVFGVVSRVVFTTRTELQALDIHRWPAWLAPIAWFVAAMFLAWNVNLLLARW